MHFLIRKLEEKLIMILLVYMKDVGMVMVSGSVKYWE